MNYQGILSEPLTAGHKAAAAIFPVERDYVSAKAEAIFLRWIYAFLPVLEQHDVLEVEQEFSFPLLNPDTNSGVSQTFLEAGKKDGVLRNRKTGEIIVLEHKTSSEDIAMGSDYWAALQFNFQPTKYIIHTTQKYPDCRTVLYNVMRKPQHRPLCIPLLDDDGVKIVLDLEGNRVRNKDGKSWRQTGEVDRGYTLQTRKETPSEYFLRLHDEIESDPFRYFVQQQIVRSNDEIVAYMRDAWQMSKQILYSRQNNLWPRNPDACHQYSTCEMFNLCAGRASVNGIDYAQSEIKHAELNMKESDGKSLLTNSSLRALRKCPQYYYLRYENPVRPVREENENLILGSLVHAAIEAFLKPFIVQ